MNHYVEITGEDVARVGLLRQHGIPFIRRFEFKHTRCAGQIKVISSRTLCRKLARNMQFGQSIVQTTIVVRDRDLDLLLLIMRARVL
ncbi:MAG: hypothetical protein EOO77_23340 [Oxalobacteraceae bacterium]|nr:MAG: hypothetical protein EOO77_23340 [Oxalobacteraceae bacterium]